MAMAGSLNFSVPALLESDDDDADKDLFLDWRGARSRSGRLVQETLGFKQVKLRSKNVDCGAKPMLSKQQLRDRDGRREIEVNGGLNNVIVVSLSDDEYDARPSLGRKRFPTVPSSSSVKHAGPNTKLSKLLCPVTSQICQQPFSDVKDVVCLDSDSESELWPSVDLKAKAVTEGEPTRASRSCELIPPIDVRSVGAVSNKQHNIRRPSTCALAPSRQDGIAEKIYLSDDLHGSKDGCTLSGELDNSSVPRTLSDKSAPVDVNVCSTASQLGHPPSSIAGSTIREDRRKLAYEVYEFPSSQDRVLNFKKVLEGSSPDAGRNANIIQGVFSVSQNSSVQVSEENVLERNELSGCSAAPIYVSGNPSANFLDPVSVAFKKCSTSTVRESKENFNLPTDIVFEDLTSSQDGGQAAQLHSNPVHDGSDDRIYERMTTYFENSECSPTRTKSFIRPQDQPRPQKSIRIAEIPVVELSADESQECDRRYDGDDTGETNRNEPFDRMKVPIPSTFTEGAEKLGLPSDMIFENLTSSQDFEQAADLHRTTACLENDDERIHERIPTCFEAREFRPTRSKSCLRPQEKPRSGKSNGVTEIPVVELSGDESQDFDRRQNGGAPGPSNRDEPLDSLKISARHLNGVVAAELSGGNDPAYHIDDSDNEDFLFQLPSKRKPSRWPGCPILEERSTNIGACEALSQTITAVKKVGRGRRRLSTDEDPSAFEATKKSRELEKLEKERSKELLNLSKEEEKKRRQEERKHEALKNREEKRLKKEAEKAEAAERRRIEQEAVKWRKGKFALESTTVLIDKTIIESKSLGPPLLQQLASKEYSYQVVSNRIEKTIVWKMKKPLEDSQATIDALGSQDDSLSNSQMALEEFDIKYVVVFLDAAEFTDMVAQETMDAHIARVKKEHPGYFICYLVNNLTRYIYKKEQAQYRTGDQSWRRPNVEQVLAEFITHHTGVRSRLCIDENEMADHIVGLTRGLAECPFKPKLTTLTINANGEHLAKNDRHRDVIKRDPWKKALAAIPNMTGAAVVAITKVYPTMRTLLNAYLDPSKTVLEKEFLLQDIVKDTALGSARAEGRRVGPVCSKRIYRILMAQNGNLRTEAVEEGEDYFRESQ